MGGVKDAKKEERSKPEQKIELERFESVRLGASFFAFRFLLFLAVTPY